MAKNSIPISYRSTNTHNAFSLKGVKAAGITPPSAPNLDSQVRRGPGYDKGALQGSTSWKEGNTRSHARSIERRERDRQQGIGTNREPANIQEIVQQMTMPVRSNPETGS